LYSSPNIIRVIKSRRMLWARHIEQVGRKRTEGRRLQEICRRTWEDNVEMDHKVAGWGDWTD
jgi:hypothetical protein